VTTKISSKGQLVLPEPIRRKLGLRAGDPLKAAIEGDRIVVSRLTPPVRGIRIGVDALTGLPVLKAGGRAQKLTCRQVAAWLADFP
jgi:AbrB family looped-hinge helix DNA binding protein